MHFSRKTPFIAAAIAVLSACSSSHSGTIPAAATPNALTLSSKSLSFTSSGAAEAQTLTASETSYSGNFTESDTCAGTAAITPTSSAGPTATFTVVPSAAGSCTVTIADSFGQHASTSIGVTMSSINAESKTAFVIKIPSRASGSAPQYVSPSTKSIAIAIAASKGCSGCSAPSTIKANLQVPSSACKAASGATTCTFPVALDPGAYTATVATYDGQNQAGNVLSSNQAIPFTVVANTANSVAMTLNGVAAGLLVSLNGTQAASFTPCKICLGGTLLIDGVSATANLSVTIEDADGNTIIGPGTPDVSLATSGAGFTATYNSKSQQISVTTPARGTKASGVIKTSISGCTACSSEIVAYITPIVGISDRSTGAVQVYNSRTKSVVAGPFMDGGSQQEDAVAFDSHGNLFAEYSTTNSFAILEYAPPYTGSPNTISLKNGADFVYPIAISFDASDTMFLADQFSKYPVQELLPPSYSTMTPLQGGASAYAFSYIDSAGNLWVSDAGRHQMLFYRAPVSSSTVPMMLPAGPSPGDIVQSGIDVMICDYSNSSIYQFDMSANAGGSIAAPACQSMAAPKLGGLIVGGGNSLLFYSVFGGTYTTDSAYGFITQGRSIDLDSFGNLYVADTGHGTIPGAVTVLAPPYTGTPQAIAGSYAQPQQLAVWP